MNTFARRIVCLCAALTVAALVSPAFAAPWAVPSGEGGSFYYENGFTDDMYFGEPVVIGNTFVYPFTNFHVNVSNGASDTQDDVTGFDIITKPGLNFATMSVTAFGSYALNGDGSSVDLDAGIDLKELGGFNRHWNGPMGTAPTFPLTSGAGSWTGDALIDVTFVFPTPHDTLHVELDTLIEGIAGASGSAELNVQFESLEVSFTLIPEPASLALMGMGGLMLLRRRR
jgi:hypothetical protein